MSELLSLEFLHFVSKLATFFVFSLFLFLFFLWKRIPSGLCGDGFERPAQKWFFLSPPGQSRGVA